MGSIPSGGPIVDELLSTVPSWFFDICMMLLELNTHLPFRIQPPDTKFYVTIQDHVCKKKGAKKLGQKLVNKGDKVMQVDAFRFHGLE